MFTGDQRTQIPQKTTFLNISTGVCTDTCAHSNAFVPVPVQGWFVMRDAPPKQLFKMSPTLFLSIWHCVSMCLQTTPSTKKILVDIFHERMSGGKVKLMTKNKLW